jgi:large subunit ribosomal protein L3
VQVKKENGKDRYNAIKIGFGESEKISKPEKGVFKKVGLPSLKTVHEFRVDKTEDYNVGDVLKADIFKEGEIVMVTGTMKGRGFAGVIKRHRFKGGDSTHGCRNNRVTGSIGASSDPSRVFKGKKMPGQYGATKVTVKGLEVLLVDLENNVVFVKGAVPGASKGIVYIIKQA